MISKEKKAAIIAEYGRKPGDTGSPEVQIAILTARITESKGSSLQTWSADDGRSETWSVRLLKEDRSGRLSYTDREVRHQKVILLLLGWRDFSALYLFYFIRNFAQAGALRQKDTPRPLTYI